MHTALAVDWIRVTTKQFSAATLVKKYAFGFDPDDWSTSHGINGYDSRMQNPHGHYIMWNSQRPEMGTNMMFDGRACSELYKLSVNLLDMVRELSQDGYQFTRLDLAIDIHGVEIDIPLLAQSEHKGSVNNDPILVTKGKDARGGSTLYLGSRTSEKFLRIYDKAKEQGLADVNWVRVELELKGETATKIASRIVHMSDDDVAIFVKGMIKGMYEPENEGYQRAIDAPARKVGSTKNTNHGAYDWLMTHVSKTIARVIIELPHRDVWKSLEAEVNKHIREMASRRLTPPENDD
jgi:hypothetical protein